MEDEIRGKITKIDEGAATLIWVQRDKPIITVRGQTKTVDTVALICVRPKVFNEIKKVVGDPVGKKFFTKDGFAYVQDQETKKDKAGKDLSVIKFDDFVIFPPGSDK